MKNIRIRREKEGTRRRRKKERVGNARTERKGKGKRLRLDNRNMEGRKEGRVVRKDMKMPGEKVRRKYERIEGIAKTGESGDRKICTGEKKNGKVGRANLKHKERGKNIRNGE